MLGKTDIAVGGRRFAPFLQVIRERASGRAAGHELLLRPIDGWGEVSATAAGLDRLDESCARALDLQVLSWLPRAARANWLPAGGTLFVNLYLSTLLSVPARTFDALRRARAECRTSLGVELNEESYRVVPPGTGERLEEIRRAGVHVMLDDLDGHHELGRLERLRPALDGVKVIAKEAANERMHSWLQTQAFNWTVSEQAPGSEVFTHEQHFGIGRPCAVIEQKFTKP